MSRSLELFSNAWTGQSELSFLGTYQIFSLHQNFPVASHFMRNRISNSNCCMQSPQKTGPTYLFDVPFYCCPQLALLQPTLATLLYLEHTRCISPLGLDLAFPVPRLQSPRHPRGSDVTSFKPQLNFIQVLLQRPSVPSPA